MSTKFPSCSNLLIALLIAMNVTHSLYTIQFVDSTLQRPWRFSYATFKFSVNVVPSSQVTLHIILHVRSIFSRVDSALKHL